MEDFQEKIMELFRSHKLVNSRFINTYHITKDVIHESKAPFEQIEESYRRQYLAQFADLINKSHPSATQKTELPHSFEYKTVLLIMPPEQFKTIVEAVIQILPDEQIQKIKSGKTVL